MRENCSALYPNEFAPHQIGDYTDTCSIRLDDEVCQFHEWAQTTPKHGGCRCMSLYQARFLTWMARSMKAKRVLELGSPAGFSLLMWSHAISLDGTAMGLTQAQGPSATSSGVARERLTKLHRKNVEMLECDITSMLSRLDTSKPYDIIFISGSKSTCEAYLQTILSKSKPGTRNRLLRSGGLIVTDTAPQTPAAKRMGEAGSLSSAYTQEFDAWSKYGSSQESVDSSWKMNANPRIETIWMPLLDGLDMGKLLD
jgi:predicted O-methyltransferase YrrM